MKQSGSANAVDWVERAAIIGAMACMAHCLALPLAIAILPILAATWHLPESFHLWMLALTLPAAGLALVQGRARHGRTGPLLIGGAGAVLLVAGVLQRVELAETLITVCGSLMLARAHLLNWRSRHDCGC